MQVTAEDRDWLVDPLSGLDLTPLGHVLADPQRTKVFHDGEYDVLILKRAWGFAFAGLFDTRVAASALGEVEQLELELRLRTDELTEIQLTLKRTRAELDAAVARVARLEQSLALAAAAERLRRAARETADHRDAAGPGAEDL